MDAWSLCKIMGWSSLSVAMTYIHPSEDLVLEAFSSMGGHYFGHSDTRKELTGAVDISEVAVGQGGGGERGRIRTCDPCLKRMPHSSRTEARGVAGWADFRRPNGVSNASRISASR